MASSTSRAIITIRDINENSSDLQVYLSLVASISYAVVMTAFVRWHEQRMPALQPNLTGGGLHALDCISWLPGQMHRMVQVRAVMGGEGNARLNGL